MLSFSKTSKGLQVFVNVALALTHLPAKIGCPVGVKSNKKKCF